jgi:hypothetical protein
METILKNFVNQIIVAKLVPILAGYFVLKATLDGASGETLPPRRITSSAILRPRPRLMPVMNHVAEEIGIPEG